MALSNLDDLEASWSAFLEDKNEKGKLTQAGAWRRDNQGEWAELSAYREGKGPRPNLKSQMGRMMVESTDAWLEAKGGTPSEPGPQPPTVASPLVFFDHFGDVSRVPAAKLNLYENLIGGFSSRPSGYTGKVVKYVSALSCSTVTNYGVTYNQAKANGWILTDGQGELPNTGASPAGTGFLGDPGSSGYRDAWCAGVLAQIGSVDGFFADDVQGWCQAISGGRIPSKYATDEAWYQAMVGFCNHVGQWFHARGKYVSFNAINRKSGDGGSDTGARNQRLYGDIAANADGIMSEWWVAHPSIPSPSLRLAGMDAWWKFWDGWRAFTPTVQAKGCGLLPLHEQGYAYGLGTFLLDWDGQHGGYIWKNDAAPWGTLHDKAIALGAPSGQATQSGSVWSRQFANGRVTVDPIAGTATIT